MCFCCTELCRRVRVALAVPGVSSKCWLKHKMPAREMDEGGWQRQQIKGVTEKPEAFAHHEALPAFLLAGLA